MFGSAWFRVGSINITEYMLSDIATMENSSVDSPNLGFSPNRPNMKPSPCRPFRT
jgi:hypothetical protein